MVMMENRSFNYFLGWLPGANGRQAGLKYHNNSGVWHDTYRLNNYVNCGASRMDYLAGRL